MESPAKKVTRLRQQLGWKKSELARVSGVPRQTILRIESGESEPQDSTLAMLVNAMEAAIARRNQTAGPSPAEAEAAAREFLKSKGIGALHVVIDWFRALNHQERTTAANVIDAYAGRVIEDALKAVRKAGNSP